MKREIYVLLPHIPNINAYKDVIGSNAVVLLPLLVGDFNPITDLCILKTDLRFSGMLPALESLDNISVGEKWYVWFSSLCYVKASFNLPRNRN